MLNKFLIILCFIGLYSPNCLFSQDWIEIDSLGKKKFLNEIFDANRVKQKCHSITYTLHNFTTRSTPVSTTRGVQCIDGNKSVISIYSQMFTYGDSLLSISVDSVSKILYIGVNIAQNEVNSSGRYAFHRLLKETRTVFKEKGRDLRDGLKVVSLESNGVEFYILRLNDDYELNRIEIHYEETEEIYYDRDPVTNKPILIIEFEELIETPFKSMLDKRYFVKETQNGLIPSENFSSFDIQDMRLD